LRVASTFALAFASAIALAGCHADVPAPRTNRAVVVTADSDVMLAGTFSLPVPTSAATTVTAGVPAAHLPAVLLLSGSGPQNRDGARAELPGYVPFRDIADSLVSHGVAVLRLDDRGTAGSTGHFAGATTFDFARDAKAAVRWLRAESHVDPARIILLGHSEGALVALLVAADDSALAGLVLLGAPAHSGRDLARWQRQALVNGDQASWPPAERAAVLARADSDAERTAAGDPWMRAWFDLDPRTIARRLRVPVLLLHGDNDQQVPVSEAAALADAFASGGARDVLVRRFPATDHLFLEDHDGDPRGYVRLDDRRVRRDVLRAITDWLDQEHRPQLQQTPTTHQPQQKQAPLPPPRTMSFR
jgi:dipeptidyl aminopeptidase/acylaminoacyl peptidase